MNIQNYVHIPDYNLFGPYCRFRYISKALSTVTVYLSHFTYSFSYIVYCDILPIPLYLHNFIFCLRRHFTYSTLPTHFHISSTLTFYLLHFTYAYYTFTYSDILPTPHYLQMFIDYLRRHFTYSSLPTLGKVE